MKSPHMLNLPLVLISMRRFPEPFPLSELPVSWSITISILAKLLISSSKSNSNPLTSSIFFVLFLVSKFFFSFLSIKSTNEKLET